MGARRPPKGPRQPGLKLWSPEKMADKTKQQIKRVGLYEIEHTIGRGNFAKVLLAKHRVTKTEVRATWTKKSFFAVEVFAKFLGASVWSMFCELFRFVVLKAQIVRVQRHQKATVFGVCMFSMIRHKSRGVCGLMPCQI